jgi:hypothetical protein
MKCRAIGMQCAGGSPLCQIVHGVRREPFFEQIRDRRLVTTNPSRNHPSTCSGRASTTCHRNSLTGYHLISEGLFARCILVGMSSRPTHPASMSLDPALKRRMLTSYGPAQTATLKFMASRVIVTSAAQPRCFAPMILC